jgi:hypothetical protein
MLGDLVDAAAESFCYGQLDAEAFFARETFQKHVPNKSNLQLQ